MDFSEEISSASSLAVAADGRTRLRRVSEEARHGLAAGWPHRIAANDCSHPRGGIGNRSSRRVAAPFCSLSAFRGRPKRAEGGWLGAGSPVTVLPFSKEKGITGDGDRRSMTEHVECSSLPKERQPLGRSAGGRNPLLYHSSSPKRRFAVRSRYSACRQQHSEAWTIVLGSKPRTSLSGGLIPHEEE
jgi:hypothetical protein